MTVDVIILTYKPDDKFLETIEKLGKQTIKPGKIIVVNTNRLYFDVLIPEDVALVYHIEENEFDHGKTRNFAASYVNSSSFVMMTQDAVPADEYLMENLVNAIKEENIAVSYARQIANDEYDELEKFARSYNYGQVPINKSKADVAKLGIKTYFNSNVCAIYDTAIFRQIGGFVDKTIFNEDMIYAKKALDLGFLVRYEPKACVFHAHNYTLRQQFKRNFDLGVSHAEYPDVFSNIKTESEGFKMIKSAILHLLKKGKPWLIFKLFLQSLYKYQGFRLGRGYQNLPRERILRYTNNPWYWKSK